MSVILSHGSIFESGADVLVNPVNCVGVMGKGLAAEFKRRFPDDFAAYKNACSENEVCIGRGLMSCMHGQSIYHFPTKVHWRERSQLSFINSGLGHLKQIAGIWGDRTIAIPALGCGLGGLPWGEVSRRIDEFMADWPADVFVFPPKDQAA